MPIERSWRPHPNRFDWCMCLKMLAPHLICELTFGDQNYPATLYAQHIARALAQSRCIINVDFCQIEQACEIGIFRHSLSPSAPRELRKMERGDFSPLAPALLSITKSTNCISDLSCSCDSVSASWGLSKQASLSSFFRPEEFTLKL